MMLHTTDDKRGYTLCHSCSHHQFYDAHFTLVFRNRNIKLSN